MAAKRRPLGAKRGRSPAKCKLRMGERRSPSRRQPPKARAPVKRRSRRDRRRSANINAARAGTQPPKEANM